MLTQKETAEAGTSTVATDALAGAPMSNHCMEMTMATHITARPPGATEDMTLMVNDLTADKVTLVVFEDRSRPLNPGEPIKFSTTLDDQPVVTRSTTPLYESCRVLAAFGLAGRVEFVKPDGMVAMTMDIERGATLTVEEGPSGPKVRKYRHADRGEVMASGSNADAPATEAVEA